MGDKAKNYIILFLLIVIVLGTTLFFVNNGKKENQLEELSLENDVVKELHKNISDFYAFHDFEETNNERKQGSFHQSSKVELSSLTDREKVVLVLRKHSQLNPDDYDESMEYKKSVFKREKMINLGKKIYGPDFDIKDEIHHDNNCTIFYDYKDGKFAITYYTGGCGSVAVHGKKLIKAEKDSDYIYLYDKYLYIEPDDENTGKTFVYNSYDKQKQLAELDSFYEYEVEKSTNKTILDAFDKTSTYKHTFKKDANGNYYWVSSEMVK